MRARWYSPQLGQFISPDPLGYIDSYNLYSYALFDPINNWAPYGLSSKGAADTSNLKNPLNLGKHALHEAWYGIFTLIDCGILNTCHTDIVRGARSEHMDAKARGAVKGTGDGLLNLTIIFPLLNYENDKTGALPYFPPEGADEALGHSFAAGSIGMYAGVFTFATLPSSGKFYLNTNNIQRSVTHVNPNSLRFSQTTAGGRGRAPSLRNSMKEHGYQGNPIDVVETIDGLVTIDNTRVALAQELGTLEIPANIHQMSDLLPSSMAGRFGTAKTWGEDLIYRTSRQSPYIGNTGTLNRPKLQN